MIINNHYLAVVVFFFVNYTHKIFEKIDNILISFYFSSYETG